MRIAFLLGICSSGLRKKGAFFGWNFMALSVSSFFPSIFLKFFGGVLAKLFKD